MTALPWCLILEEQAAPPGGETARWFEDLVAGLAPRPLVLVYLGAGGAHGLDVAPAGGGASPRRGAGDRAAETRPPPPHVVEVIRLAAGERGLSTRVSPHGVVRPAVAPGPLGRLFRRDTHQAYRAALERVRPLLEAVARGRGAEETTLGLAAALEVLAGDGPHGLAPRAVFEGHEAAQLFEEISHGARGAGGLEGGPRYGPAELAAAARRALRPLAELLACRLPPAELYLAAGGGQAGLVAAVAARRAGGVPVVLAETTRALERRLLQVHWQHEALAAAQGGAVAGAELELRAVLLLHRMALERADLILAASEHDRALQRLAGAPAERVCVMPPGLLLEQDMPRGTRPDGSRPQVEIVGNLGPVDPLHDTRTFVRCARVLIERLDLVRFVAVGPLEVHPAYLARCVEEATLLGMAPLLRFLGPYRIEDVLPQLDCLVVTGLGGASPPGLPEALALGLPVVAVDTPPCRELLGGDEPAGLLAPPGEEQALAAAVVRILRDAELRRRLGEAARRRVAALPSRQLALARLAARLEELRAAGVAPAARDQAVTGRKAPG
ncbi:MAG: hypothetical protein KatS3mg102_0563 [Planctomycetota bacterium]|nr:MAG: hypothetical protein KatS3mg102_0563 [Planctomycetota bacterium]